MKDVTGTTLVLMGSGLLLIALVLDSLNPWYQAALLVASMVMNLWGIVKIIREKQKSK